MPSRCRYQKTNGFNQFPVVDQRLLVLDIVGCGPCLNAISIALQLLDLLLQRVLELLLLCGIRRRVNLLVDVLEGLHAFGDLLEAFVDLYRKLPSCHGACVRPERRRFDCVGGWVVEDGGWKN